MNVAQVAAQETTSVPITIFDPKQLSLVTGFLVKTAAKLAQAGSTVPEILVVLNEQIKHTHVFAAMDTLQFMQLREKINSIVSFIGELLQIKPSLNMYDGNANTEQVPTRNHAINRLIGLLMEYSPYEKVALLHSDAADCAQVLLQEIRNILPGGEILLEQINPVPGAHIRSKVVSFADISKR